jgi:hypothetical protein
MKKMLIIIVMVLLGLNYSYGASAWFFVPDRGDTGWQTYTYTAGPTGFAGTAGFVVSNVIDNAAYSELLLDKLSQGGGGTNRGFELGNLSGFALVGPSFANVSDSVTAYSFTMYTPTAGYYFADVLGVYDGVITSHFSNATRQAGTVGSILETGINVGPGGNFSFDWAFLGNDSSPWNDFALFYLKDLNGIVFYEGLAQVGSPVPIPASFLLLGSGLLGLLGLARKGKRQVG